jgi:hypothetical protein
MASILRSLLNISTNSNNNNNNNNNNKLSKHITKTFWRESDNRIPNTLFRYATSDKIRQKRLTDWWRGDSNSPKVPWCGSKHCRWKCQLTFSLLLQIKAVECCRSCELAYRSLYLKRKFSVCCPATWLPAAPTRNADLSYRNNRLFRWNAFRSLSDVCAGWPAEHEVPYNLQA